LKLFSDLRLSNTQVTEQFTALILAGVAAVVIGGVAHISAHRNQHGLPAVRAFATELATENTVVQPAVEAELLALAGSDMALDAAEAVKTPANQPTPTMMGSIAALVLAPVTVTPAVQKVAALVAPPAAPEYSVRTVEIGRNTALAGLLIAEADLATNDVRAVMKALAAVQKERLTRGTEVTLRFAQVGDDETFDGLTFQPTLTTEVRVKRLADGSYKAEKINTPIERQRNAVEGTIRTSLMEAAKTRGVPRNVIASMVRTFSHDVDLQRDLNRGDTFRVLYDQPRAKNGQAVGDATIIYAAIQSRGVKKAIYRVIYNDGSAEYFNERGEGVRRGLMRTPVDGAHVTSGYGMRRHPIMGYTKFHKGVDFAAPTGTPVFAAGDGVVEDVGFRSGYGNFVLLRHQNGLETAYGHMSRFARGLSIGDRVGQGDVIAYVGSTGRSTGPHLHFEVRVGEQPVNPLNVNMQTMNKLSGRSLMQFNAGKQVIESEFRRRTLAVNELKTKPVQLASAQHATKPTNLAD
jgi:murein DD-endopeptidase MepM/ murein hydrolase activator NlpD